ncbi:MAG TPA: hypothetical protein VJZ26_05770 [Blastocatellia bacterium]|nr:hypothetical protein [Blastocatellia bacterium]
MTDILEGAKKLAQRAAQAAQQAMSDKLPKPIELGGAVEKLPKPGAVISPPPVNAPAPGVPGGGQAKGQ